MVFCTSIAINSWGLLSEMPIIFKLHKILITVLTVPTGPNLTESGPKANIGFAFGVRSRSTRADPERTPSKPRADAKRTSKANPNFRGKSEKRTRGPLYVTELSIRITDKLSWPIGASTNQKVGRVDQSARQTIIQCKSVCLFHQHVRVDPVHFIKLCTKKKPNNYDKQGL